MEPQTQPGRGTVVVRLNQRLFYGCVAAIASLLLLGIVFFVGVQLGRHSQAAPAPVALQPPSLPPQPGVTQAQPVQPGQANPFAQPAVRKARLPAGDEVPIGDNPRLALPELAKTNYVYDFGDIPPDEIAETTVTILNKGTKDLVIKSVRASCGCTATNIGSDVIPPGKTTQLRVTYDPTYHNDAGKQITRQVIIESNDPAAPVVEFTIRANVLPQ